MVADIEELENLDVSEIHPRRLNAKGVLTPQRGGHFTFPAAGGKEKMFGRDHEFREPTRRREQPVSCEGLREELQGEPEGPQPTESTDDAEARAGFWSIQGDFIYRHHIEPQVQLYSPREESFPFPLKYIDVSRSTHTNLDVKQERGIDDNWNVDVNRSLSESWKGFTKVQGEKCGPAWEKQLQKKEKEEWENEAPKLDNARGLEGIYFIDAEGGEYQETIKNARNIGSSNGGGNALQKGNKEALGGSRKL